MDPDSKLKLNVISDTFNLKSVVFDRNLWFLIEIIRFSGQNLQFLLKSVVFDAFWNHEV